ncbi:MAG: DUF3883 domain-containing protein [Firmicutes bacterium]|nr:DUF3883 domain-containing protein [Bacillota bacterium]
MTKIDLKSINFDAHAVNNSIRLLQELKLVGFDKKSKKFNKKFPEAQGYDNFLQLLYKELRVRFSDVFQIISNVELMYSENEAKLYFKRNSISLDLAGLIMLLEGMGKVKIKGSDVFVLDKSLLAVREEKAIGKSGHKTLSWLKKLLEANEKLGDEAEMLAIEYEIELLRKDGISKNPERISEYNVVAGYDIVSYMAESSNSPDKFIEVKSCSDEKWIFYISRNEFDVAKAKQNSYFLYLFNRKTREFRVIQNPYNFFNRLEIEHEWVMTPQIYKIQSLEDL